uniref:BHLH domain-containing protein n=1 Tax=Oryza meridionalis TaxID=40149 RepID=A0A0E0E320_9ORYZ
MDAIFALPPDARARAMERAAARLPGCLYLCLWAPAAAIAGGVQPNHLFCLDAWIGVAGGGGDGGGGGDRALELFEAYRGALCAAVSGCVPGWAYKEGAACMELTKHHLAASASLQVQQQFYHESGTKMAVFMGCDSGEIEVGLSAASATATAMAAAAVVGEMQQSILEELLQMPPPPSSSSSSLLSLSVGSPEYSSLVRSMATSVGASAAAEPSPVHGGLLAPVYGEFPGSDDDAAMAQAMLEVISTPAPPPPPWRPPRRRARSSSSPRRATAFKAYNAALSPRARPRPGAPGQRMIKTGISLLASVHMQTRSRELAAARQRDTHAAPPPPPPPPPPSSSQLHHMISERRRRERINDSFQTLRALLPLPPDSKKDKAAVLATTTEYMDKLISQVSELEAQLATRSGEARWPDASGGDGGGGESSSERVQVDVVIAGSSTSTDHAREVSIRVTVRAECDVSELVVAVLARLREMDRFAVVSVDAGRRSSSFAQASLTLRVMAGDVRDETSLKEAVAKAVDSAVTAQPVAPPPPPASP